MDLSALNTQKSKPKSLQDLSAAKALEVFRKDNDPVQSLTSLDPTAQQVFFPCLWQDYERLLGVERELHETQDCVRMRDYFGPKWRHLTALEDEIMMTYRAAHLVHEYGEMITQDLSIRQMCGTAPSIELCCCWESGGRCETAGICIQDLISSQQLLVRLKSVLCLDRVSLLREEEVTTRFELTWTNDNLSVLEVSISDVEVEFWFTGEAEVITDVIELLNWLVFKRPPEASD